MIEIKYLSRFGNHLFQYCFGRILAEELGYRLKTDPIPGFPNTSKPVEGMDYSQGYPVQKLEERYVFAECVSWRHQYKNLESVLRDRTRRKIVLEGYFERYEYYRPYKELIRNDWMRVDRARISEDIAQIDIQPDDLVVHVRRGDIVRLGMALPFSYFEEALSRTNYNRIFICTDWPGDPFFRLFKKYKPHFFHKDELSDFCFMMAFHKIVQSPSTFSWWASFLSNASEIYTPIPLKGWWSAEHPEIDLVVNDEARYSYIKCKGIYIPSAEESLAT